MSCPTTIGYIYYIFNTIPAPKTQRISQNRGQTDYKSQKPGKLL